MRRSLSSTVVLSGMLAPLAVFAGQKELHYQYNQETKQLKFYWPDDMKAGVAVEDGKVLFTFSEGVEIKDPEALLSISSGVISNVEYGYDSVRITPAEGLKPSAILHKKDAEVSFIMTKGFHEDLNLSLAQARLNFEKGQVGYALEQVNMLAEKNPNNADVLATKAEFKNRVGKWRNALTLYDKAIALAPQREDIRDQKESILEEHGTSAQISVEHQDIGHDRTEFFTRAEGVAAVNHALSLGIKVERDDADVDNVQRAANGGFESLNDAFYRGEVYLGYTLENSDMAKVSILAGESNVGAGGSYTLVDNYGKTVVGMEYNAPNWDFIEGVVDDGTRDRVYVERQQRINPRLVVNAAFGLNQYNVGDWDNVAKSSSLDGSIVYTIPSTHQMAKFLGQDGELSIRYLLDAEYASSVDTVNGVNGPYQPLPLTTREVHGLVLHVGKQISQPFRLEAFGGYARDRLGGGGANFGADAFYDITRKAQLHVGYLHSVSTELTSETLDSIMAGLSVKF